MNKWMKYLLWLIGMFVLFYVAYRIENIVQARASQTFQMAQEVWVVTLLSIIMGAYVSLLLISGRPSLNVPMLVCVFLPSILLGLAFPMAFLFHGLRVPMLLQSDPNGLLHFVSGFSLVMGLFNGKPNKQSI